MQDRSGGGKGDVDAGPGSPYEQLLQLGQARPKGFLSQRLQQYGYSCLDGGFSAKDCAILRTEIDALAREGLLRNSPSKLAAEAPAGGGEAASTSVELSKTGVLELTLQTFDAKGTWSKEDSAALEQMQALCPALLRLSSQWRDLTGELNRAAPFLKLSQLFHFKVARVTGGGFPAHFDTDPGTGRCLSLCLWLNENWTPAQGGTLRVFPFPFDKEDVAPLEGRVCVFCSHQTLHRVMPASSAKPRYCVSMMFFGNQAPFPTQVPLPRAKASLAPRLLPLCSPANARVLVFLLFEEECVRSMEESFGETEGRARQRAVANFRKRLAGARSRLPAAVVDLLQKELPLQRASNESHDEANE